MDIDDIIYLACLLSCIAFGSYYRKIDDSNKRKIIGTCFGVLIVFIVSGFHIIHCFISFLISALIVTNVHPKKSHLVSFFFMFGYLIFFRTTTLFGIPAPPGHTNMIQMILTLKIVGVAFELNTAYNNIKERKQNADAKETEFHQKLNSSEKSIKTSDDEDDFDYVITKKLDLIELTHYCFNYIGVLTGPYYRYRTFRDYFDKPFKDYADCTTATLEKLKSTGIYGVVYLITNYTWPLSYVLQPEFLDRSFFYRVNYVWPTFITFRMRIYIGLTLSECVCTNAGFGAYPKDAEIASGEGPKKPYFHYTKNPEKLEYDFKTINNIDAYNTEVCWTFREAMKHWNICVQYWLAVNVYKRFPSKKFRTIVTLLISSFWHGFYPGHYFCIMGAPFYVPVEEMYNSILRKNATGLRKQIINILFWISKFYSLGYLGISFQLLTLNKIWAYYSCVYYFGYIYYVTMLIIALSIKQLHRGKRTKTNGDKKVEDSVDNKKVL